MDSKINVMIEVELTLLFILCMFFTALYELRSRTIPLGVFTWISWWVFSMYYVVSGSQVVAYAFLPFGIGVIYFLRVLLAFIDMRRMVREIE